MCAGSVGPFRGVLSDVVVLLLFDCALLEEDEESFEVLLKNAVIWRCAGSLAAPANCRLTRGPADIGGILLDMVVLYAIGSVDVVLLLPTFRLYLKFHRFSSLGFNREN